jgi:hypothetical protein
LINIIIKITPLKTCPSLQEVAIGEVAAEAPVVNGIH